MEKPLIKPLPPKEGNEENEKKKKGTKKKKRGNKKKEVTAYPRVYEIMIGNRKYVAPNDYYDNESEYNDLPMPFTYISDHDLKEHTTFDIENLWETNSENDDVNNCHSISTIHASSHNDIESSKLGDEVFKILLLLMIICLIHLLLVTMMVRLQMNILWKITILFLMMTLCLQSLTIIIKNAMT